VSYLQLIRSPGPSYQNCSTRELLWFLIFHFCDGTFPDPAHLTREWTGSFLSRFSLLRLSFRDPEAVRDRSAYSDDRTNSHPVLCAHAQQIRGSRPRQRGFVAQIVWPVWRAQTQPP